MRVNTLYLVRHGENRANITREFSYKSVDYPLTERGVRQARQTAEYLKGKDVHEIYCSPLKRAVQTAQIIGEAVGLEAVVLECFREVNVGALEGRPPSVEAWALHDRIFEDWSNGRHDVAYPDGEDYLTLLERMRAGLDEATRGKSGRNIVIVGHGGIFTATLQDICRDVSLAELQRVPKANCSITEIELHTNGSEVSGLLKSWAACDHLGDVP